MRTLLVLAALVPAAVMAADQPAGRIVYARKDGERVTLHKMKADGTGDSELSGASAKLCVLPTWSPDGKRIAFSAGQGQPTLKLGLVNADGTGYTMLDLPDALAAMPAWSPDGKQLAYTSREGIWVVDADGSNRKRITPEGTQGFFPFWSRDGKSIGYTQALPDQKGEIVLARIDGSATETLTQTGAIAAGGADALSPDGKQLLFLAVDLSAKKASLHLLDLDSRKDQALADVDVSYVEEPFQAPTPAWSADGKSALAVLPSDKGRGVFRVSLDGKTKTRLTPEGVDCFSASATP